MSELKLPYIQLPEEFVELLKSNLSGQVTTDQVFKKIRTNRALFTMLEVSFQDLDDGRGLEKTMMAQGWQNFRDRMASLYVSKTLYGHYPALTDPSLVEEVTKLESDFAPHGVHSNSRVFMLGFYLKLAQLELQRRENNKFVELQVPVHQVLPILRLTAGRSEKIDWLILIVLHLLQGLGEKVLAEAILKGKTFDEIYTLLSPIERRRMHTNLLSYSASIRESENFLYEKI